MHPLVRDLYKRAVFVGRDYPAGIEYVREAWKRAIRDPSNCPSCYRITGGGAGTADCRASATTATIGTSTWTRGRPEEEEERQEEEEEVRKLRRRCDAEIRRAVALGRFWVREMEGVIRLKKYRTMKKRYGDDDVDRSFGGTTDSATAESRIEEQARKYEGGGSSDGSGGSTLS